MFIYIKVFLLCFRYLIFDHVFIFFTCLFLLELAYTRLVQFSIWQILRWHNCLLVIMYSVRIWHFCFCMRSFYWPTFILIQLSESKNTFWTFGSSVYSQKKFDRFIVLMLLPPPKKEVMFLVRSVCLSVCLSVCFSVCPSDYSQTCERILTKFSVGVGLGSRTKWYNFGGDPDHASDPGVQSPKSGSSGSADVCALWVHFLLTLF